SNAPLRMRVHLMLRNLQGLWVCTNAGCSQAHARTGPCPTGMLPSLTALTCSCGARVLELLYCEACGEIFFGGYRKAGQNPNEWFLSPDHPDLESSPDLVSVEREYSRYAVFWPAHVGLSPISNTWQEDTIV